MPDVAVTVIGAGVVGLAVGAEVARHFSPVFILERRHHYGEETSSRNSEVIHAGLYYPHGSLKALLCVRGRRMLYELCARHLIPHSRLTKVITATCAEELPELERLYRHGLENGVELRMLSAREVHALEPHIATAGGILSPETGIISAHRLMDYFYHTARERGADVQLRCEVAGVEPLAEGFRVAVREGGELSFFTTERVVNAAGLESDTIAASAGIDVDAAGYRLRYCKGSYFALTGPASRLIHRLVYPIPPRESLGVHAVVDLGGRVKFGPDVEYLAGRSLGYGVEEAKRPAFAAAIRRILPSVRDEDLTPDTSGIRAKLQGPGEPVRDFIIRDESDRGLPGLVNLVGIESPGLTASPAIAGLVLEIIREGGNPPQRS
ncbi:MAG: NAD(P)/FAD-dependent oxidoreductase [Bacteroidota bacterium]